MAGTGNFPRRIVQANEILIQEGDEGDAAFFILSGTFEVVKRIGGRDERLAVLGPDMIVGEMAIIDGTRRSASVRCIAPAEVVVVDRTVFQGKLQRLDRLTQLLLETLSQRLRSRTNDYVQHLQMTAEDPEDREALCELMAAWQRASPADRGAFWRMIRDSVKAEAIDVLLPTGQRCRYTTSIVI